MRVLLRTKDGFEREMDVPPGLPSIRIPVAISDLAKDAGHYSPKDMVTYAYREFYFEGDVDQRLADDGTVGGVPVWEER